MDRYWREWFRPLLITEALQKNSVGLNFSYIDNIDPSISEKLDELSDKLSTTLFVVEANLEERGKDCYEYNQESH